MSVAVRARNGELMGHPQGRNLWDYVETFGMIQPQAGQIPHRQPCLLKRDGRDPRPVNGPRVRAEAIGLGADPRPVPHQVVQQPCPYPQHVDHGQHWHRADAQGALFAGFRDEGCVSVDEDPRLLAPINFRKQHSKNDKGNQSIHPHGEDDTNHVNH